MNGNNNILGSEKIGKLIIKFSIPCIVSLIINAIYNIVDQIFIGQGVGKLANGATNVVFPITVIALAFSLLYGDGCASFMNIKQGEGNGNSLSKGVFCALFLSVSTSLVFVLFGYIFHEQLLTLFGVTQGTHDYAKTYILVILAGIPFSMFVSTMSCVIRADGRPQTSMLITLAGAILNIILDPIMIFVCKLEVFGAAIATIIGQIVSAILSIIYLFKSRTFKLNKAAFKFDFSAIKQILRLGFSSFLTQVCIVVIMVVMNNLLVKDGGNSVYGEDTPLAVFGIVFKIFQIVVSLFIGVAVGGQPIMGYNYGAKNYDRVLKTIKLVMIIVFGIGAVATVLLESLPRYLLMLFGKGDKLYVEYGVYCIRTFLACTVFCGIAKAANILLQSMGKPLKASILSLLQNIIIFVPAAFILSYTVGIYGTTWCGPIADFTTAVVAVIFMLQEIKKIKALQKDLQDVAQIGVDKNAE